MVSIYSSLNLSTFFNIMHDVRRSGGIKVNFKQDVYILHKQCYENRCQSLTVFQTNNTAWSLSCDNVRFVDLKAVFKIILFISRWPSSRTFVALLDSISVFEYGGISRRLTQVFEKSKKLTLVKILINQLINKLINQLLHIGSTLFNYGFMLSRTPN